MVEKGEASNLLSKEYGGRGRSPVSHACVSLVIPAGAKSDQDRNSTPASITTLGRMQVHQRDTSILITQLRVYSVSYWVYREICFNKVFRTLLS